MLSGCLLAHLGTQRTRRRARLRYGLLSWRTHSLFGERTDGLLDECAPRISERDGPAKGCPPCGLGFEDAEDAAGGGVLLDCRTARGWAIALGNGVLVNDSTRVPLSYWAVVTA
jgi:hypothetical protein